MIIDLGEKLIQVKMVFYGPAMSGKTTTWKSLLKTMKNLSGVKVKGEFSIDTSHKENPRTLFFDMSSITIPLNKWKLKVQAWTATGQDFYCGTRKSVVVAPDGIIFVADSQTGKFELNMSSWKELEKFFGMPLEVKIPITICLNKRDLAEIIPYEDFYDAFRHSIVTNVFETVATRGEGVQAAFLDNLRMILEKLRSATNISMEKFRKLKSKIEKTLSS